MGRERSGTGQYLYFCAAGLIMAILAACAPSFITMSGERDNRVHLQRAQHLIGHGDFEGAVRESEQALALSQQGPPAEAALFNLGMVNIHYANPEKDYKKALGYFNRLVQEFPESSLTEEARLWAGVLEVTLAKAEQEHRANLRRQHLERAQHLIGKGDFEGALQENQKVLSLSPKSPPGDTALFNMGLIHVHYANPKREYKKALGFFKQLEKEFPGSPLKEEAKVWVSVLQAMEKSKQIDIEIEEKKKVLRR